MKETMKLLIALQGCDSRIRRIQIKKEEGPGRIQTLKESLDEALREVDEDVKQMESVKKERRQTEQDIDDFENRIVKSTIKLNSIKSNKEYQAALKEIEDLKKAKSKLEDKVLAHMETMDALETKCQETRSRGENLRVQFEKDEKEIRVTMKALDRDLESLQHERSDFIQSIDPEILRRYDSLITHRQGIAISPVVKGVCMGCHMGIPPQKFNELIRGDALMNCPHCTRMIYWGEDEKYQSILNEDH